MKKLFVISAILFLAVPSFASGAGLTGPYTLHTSIAGNESDQTCSFSQTGNKVTGSCKSDTAETKMAGTVEGNKVTLKLNTEYNGDPLTVTYTGTLDDSGTVKGDADVQPMGVTGDFKLSPIKPDATAPKK